MRPGSDRWHEVSQSEYAHEREGLAHIRDLLPDRPPYRAWSNFEFRDSQGKWYEVDLLVLGEGRLHLVELKHYRGTITGTAYKWLRNRRTEDSPLLSARWKAQRLVSVIRQAAGSAGLAGSQIPYIQECVFLHAKDGRCQLPRADATDLFGLDGHEQLSGLPSIGDRLLESRRSSRRSLASDTDLLQLFNRIGFAVRREREIGSWRLTGAPLAEGEGWQDWPGEHRMIHNDPVRIRFFVSPDGASQTSRDARRQLVEREYELTSRLHHEGLLRPRDYVEHDLGVGLVYPREESSRRLDLWLADRPGGTALRVQVDLIRQLAEALAYAHRHRVVHRGLTPASVVVADDGDDGPTARLCDWQVAGVADPAQPGNRRTGGSATRIFQVLERAEADPSQKQVEAYLAPEGRWNADCDRIRLDVFALGAVTYHIVSGRPPAANDSDLRERLQRDRGLDLVADVPEVFGTLRRLVLEATRPTVSERLRDLPKFLKLLDDVDAEIGAAVSGASDDPLDAPPGTLLGNRFELRRRLGSGSTAVGLLVVDRNADKDERVLKVALNDAAAGRLLDEAEVLRTLRNNPHPRIVRLVEETPLRIGNRVALLLESAGGETLADVLRERPRLSLDLLERWGNDLLEALVGLDKAGVDHRDIKPANLGVRRQRSNRADHLVLFDFSLSKAGAGSIKAGTPPYLDPFLGHGTRTFWDSAAERYAAAVTLFEMATGAAPKYGDGRSDPAAITDEVAIEPGLFDPSVADRLARFFRRALRREPRERFDTAADMLGTWRAVFASTPTTVPEGANARAAAATVDTPLVDAGLTARALSAVEPFHLATAGDLAAVDPGRLSRLRGVADPTRREVRSRAKQWRDRFGAAVRERQPTDQAWAPDGDDDPLLDPVGTAEALVAAAGGSRAKVRRKAARVLLGLDGEADAFATLAGLTEPLGVSSQPQVSRMLADIRDAWADEVTTRERLDHVMLRVEDALAGLGGVAWVDDVVSTLANDGSTRERCRIVAGLVRAALDRADDKVRGGDDRHEVVRRRRRSDGHVLLASHAQLAEAGGALGGIADDLVNEAAAVNERIVPTGAAAARLGTAWPADIPAPDDTSLVRLAARLSKRAAASRRGELHDRDLEPAAAAALALAGLAPSQRLSPDDVLSRVRARFPDLAKLPTRPRLDRVLEDAGLPLRWNGEAYAIPSRRPDTTLASQTFFTRIPVSTAGQVQATREDALLAESVISRSFLALGVTARHLLPAREALVNRHGAQVVDVTAVLIDALRDEARRADIPWDQVRAADAANPGSRPAQGLAALVQRAAPAVERAITEAATAADEGSRPVLLIEAAPLARYGRTDVIARLADITARRSQAMWLLLPLDMESAPALDGVPVPLAYSSQFVRLYDDWLRSPALEGEPA